MDPQLHYSEIMVDGCCGDKDYYMQFVQMWTIIYLHLIVCWNAFPGPFCSTNLALLLKLMGVVWHVLVMPTLHEQNNINSHKIRTIPL